MSNQNPFTDGFFKSMGLPSFTLPNFTLPGFGEGAPNPFQKLGGFVLPTINVEELDKKIADMKSIEQWIDTQASLLRTTIQALEVQRNTVVMLKSFGAVPEVPPEADVDMRGMGLPTGWPAHAPATQKAAETAPAKPLAEAKAKVPEPPPAAKPVVKPERERLPEPDIEDELDEEELDEDMPPDTGAAAKPVVARKKVAASSAANPEAAQTAINNATAWWKLLQDQFTQVAGAAAKPSGAIFSPSKVPAPGVGGAKAAKGVTSPAGKVAAKKAPAKKAVGPKAVAKKAVAKKASAGKTVPKAVPAKRR
jgi:hypothetical protein